MKRSTIAVLTIIVSYLIVSGLIISAVAGSFGVDSIEMILVIIVIGPIALYMIVSHEGLNKFLSGLDRDNK